VPTLSAVEGESLPRSVVEAEARSVGVVAAEEAAGVPEVEGAAAAGFRVPYRPARGEQEVPVGVGASGPAQVVLGSQLPAEEAAPVALEVEPVPPVLTCSLT
jgi:hypothetical protein